MSTAHIECNAVTKRYGRATILENISLGISKGEFVSLIGPSGCGKSTLLKSISGLASLTSGKITIDGKSPRRARKQMSFIFQDATLLPWRTVESNIALGLELDGVARKEREEKIKELLSLVGLDHVTKSYPRELSGGMKMRVSIARALASRPEVLLMDEPFAALDEITRDRMNEELLRLREEHRWTAVFVTHSVAEAVFLSNRIIVLSAHPGRIACDLKVPLAYPRTNETRTSNEFESLVSQVSHALREGTSVDTEKAEL